MSFSDHYVSSSYRKMFGDAQRFAGSSSRNVSPSGFRSPSLSRASPMANRRSGRSASFSPIPSDCLDLTQTSVITSELKIIRTNEKEQLQGLNDRFAMFIDKVRTLEQQNKVLETELGTLRQRQNGPTRIGDLYNQEIRDLRSQIDDLNTEKSQMIIERDNLEDDLQKMRTKFEDEVRAREDAEHVLRSFKKDVDDATLARLDLERKVESLLDEINFLKRVHDEEVSELTNMMHTAQVSVEVEVSKPDLTSALKDIRCQYESLASKNLQSAEEWYKTKFANLHEQAARTNEAIRANREEISDYRRQLQSKTIEMETLRGANESLERQIREMEDAHNMEISGYQESIAHLENDLRGTKSEMARHLREYQDLLNVKMALDIEIAAYRKLLEGEETHFGTGTSFLPGNHGGSLLNYSYSPRPYSSSGRSSRKDREEEGSGKPKTPTPRETFEEIIEETIITKKADKGDADDINSN